MEVSRPVLPCLWSYVTGRLLIGSKPREQPPEGSHFESIIDFNCSAIIPVEAR